MAYYNRDYKKMTLKKENLNYLNRGHCAQILHNNDIILKEYYSDTLLSCRLKAEVFDILKDINNPHFIELFEIYSELDLALIKDKRKYFPFTIDAYTAKYYPDNVINSLLEPKDYILDNFKELELLFDIFTCNKIMVDDIKRQNAIFSHNGIIIIDPDTFYITQLPKEFIATENKKQLLLLLKTAFIYDTKKCLNYSNEMLWNDIEYFNISITENTDITYEISKKLKYVKKPIEIFQK